MVEVGVYSITTASSCCCVRSEALPYREYVVGSRMEWFCYEFVVYCLGVGGRSDGLWAMRCPGVGDAV